MPFCAESSCPVSAGGGRQNALWYKRNFAVPAAWKGRDVILNFGAVDWQADVWVNGVKVGSHTGGYTPLIQYKLGAECQGRQRACGARVGSDRRSGVQPHGKQVAKPNGIWYTPVTGIWQTSVA